MVAVLLMNCVVQGQTKKEKKDQTKIAEKVKAAMAEQEVRMAAYEKKRIAAVGVYLEGKSISAEIVKGLREGFLVRGMTAEEFSLKCSSPTLKEQGVCFSRIKVLTNFCCGSVRFSNSSIK